mgnify:CR=1 FL=1
MSFLDVEGLHDEDMLIYDDDAEERVLQGPDEDMMPEGGDEDVPTPGQGWANYHAADGCKCGTFELKPCGACNKDVGRRHLGLGLGSGLGSGLGLGSGSGLLGLGLEYLEMRMTEAR